MADTGEIVVDIQDDELVRLIHQKFDDEPQEIAPPTIYRVVPRVREMGSVAYDPKVISIGPFHRMKEALQPMERIKWRSLRDLIRRSSENSPEKFIQKVRSLEARARSCYSEQVLADSNAFVETMLLDGCFIIVFFIEWELNSDPMESNIIAQLFNVNWNILLILDLLLLENQIPFFVLESLFDLCVIPELSRNPVDGSRAITLKELAFKHIISQEVGPLATRERIYDISIPSVVHHLLHLFHSSVRPTISTSNNSDTYQGTRSAKRAIKNIKYLVSYYLYWWLSLFLYCRMPPAAAGKKTSWEPSRLPSATELQDAGVEFKKKEKPSSSLDITFRERIMEMPRMFFNPRTIHLFRNLIAFEQCCPTAGSHFTAYMALMDNLIQTPEDFALLVNFGILESNLPKNEDVAELFYSLRDGTYLNYKEHYLVELFKDLDNFRATEIHRLRAIHRWRAMMMHDYFSKPWAIISLIAAIVFLILTMVQTYFAVLAYFHPPS